MIHARQMLLIAGQAQAYTVIGMIPSLNGKIPKHDLDVILPGDPRLRRPYLIVTVPSKDFPEAEHAVAHPFVEYLRSESIQEWIAEYGAAKNDDQPLFFRVAHPRNERPLHLSSSGPTVVSLACLYLTAGDIVSLSAINVRLMVIEGNDSRDCRILRG